MMNSASCRHSSLIIHHSSFRSGVSLLEVLVSIGVIMVGLLGVAAVLPLGIRNMAEIAKSDNAAACGASALRDMRAWQVLNPSNWRQPAYSSGWNLNTLVLQMYNGDMVRRHLPYGQSFAIDPLFVARAARTFTPAGDNTTDPRVGYFPYDPETQPTDRTDYWKLYMRRVTIPLQGALNWANHDAFYSRFFTWPDDPRIPLPTEATERPRQVFLCSDGSGHALPDSSITATPSVAQTDGEYTWMAILTPSANETGSSDWNPSTDVAAETVTTDTSLWYWQRTQYLAQIVVFHKRDFQVPANYTATDEPPPERTVKAVLSDGYGGGDVTLSVPAVNPDKYSQYLTLRKNQWIMLAGQSTKGNIFRWYRVVSPGDAPTEPVGGNWRRYVTLAGPDWNMAWCRNTDEVAAVIVDGVIGVYTMTFEIDRDSQVKILWP